LWEQRRKYVVLSSVLTKKNKKMRLMKIMGNCGRRFCSPLFLTAQSDPLSPEELSFFGTPPLEMRGGQAESPEGMPLAKRSRNLPKAWLRQKCVISRMN
jgi:hypothetical protein